MNKHLTPMVCETQKLEIHRIDQTPMRCGKNEQREYKDVVQEENRRKRHMQCE